MHVKSFFHFFSKEITPYFFSQKWLPLTALILRPVHKSGYPPHEPMSEAGHKKPLPP